MYGWWSYEYLQKNSNIPIPLYIYSTEYDSNVMIIKITDSDNKLPDKTYNWICMGKINNLVKIINFNTLLESGNYSNCQKQNKDIKNIVDKQQIYYGWYSQKYIDIEMKKKRYNVSDRNNKSVSLPLLHKYKTPCGNIVSVTHVTSTFKNKPEFEDTCFISIVSDYVENIYFDK